MISSWMWSLKAFWRVGLEVDYPLVALTGACARDLQNCLSPWFPVSNTMASQWLSLSQIFPSGSVLSMIPSWIWSLNAFSGPHFNSYLHIFSKRSCMWDRWRWKGCLNGREFAGRKKILLLQFFSISKPHREGFWEFWNTRGISDIMDRFQLHMVKSLLYGEEIGQRIEFEVFHIFLNISDNFV